MKRSSLALSLLLLPLVAAGCSSGPKRLARSWDKWVNQKYTQDSLVHGALLQDIIPIYPLVGLFAMVGDIIVVNPYYFWSRDAWARNGTAFVYTQAEGAENEVGKWPTPKQ
jgi:hypothetical protein